MRHTDTAVLLPGTGSDEVFVRSAFVRPVTSLGLTVHAPTPRWGRELVRGYLAALDEAAASGPIVAGGVSMGAHLAALWATRNPSRCAGLLLALPAFTGDPGDAPAVRLALATRDLVAEHGVERAISIATADVSDWLAVEIGRAWPRYGTELAAALDVSARQPAPTLVDLRGLDVPVGIACCTDDPVHPAAVAEQWAKALPQAALERTTLHAMGTDVAALGQAAVSAFQRVTALCME